MKRTVQGPDGNWYIPVVFIRPGVGSSGQYSEGMLKQYGPTAWPKGTKVYFDHVGWEDHSTESMAGVFVDDTTWSDEVGGLINRVRVYDHARELVDSVAEDVGLSIEVPMEAVTRSVVGDGEEPDEITEIRPHPLNAVAFVPVPGREGAVLPILESARKQSANLLRESVLNAGLPASQGGVIVTPEDVKSIVDAVVEALRPQPVAPVDEPDGSANLADVVSALAEAELPKVSRDRAVTAIMAGAGVSEAIAAEKSLVESLRAELKVESAAQPAGVVHTSGEGTPSELRSISGGWKFNG